jgi:hypothetical protein
LGDTFDVLQQFFETGCALRVEFEPESRLAQNGSAVKGIFIEWVLAVELLDKEIVTIEGR